MGTLKPFQVTLILNVEAEDFDAAQNLAFDANNHLRETFNDNDTIGATAFKVEPLSGPEPMTAELAQEILLEAYIEMEITQASGNGKHGALGYLREVLAAGAPVPTAAFLIRYCRDKGLDDGTDRVLEAIEFLEKA